MDLRQDTGRRVDHTTRGRRAPHRGWLLRRPTLAGVAVALLFWWWSLDPSMLPRSWYAQGAVSGLSAAIGYLLARRLPRLLAHGVTAAVLVVGAVVVTRDVVLDGSFDWANDRFARLDTTAPGVAVPTTPTASGSLIFGESLGSFGAEAAFRGGAAASLANLVAGSDGALFTGPTAANHIWDQLTDDREPGSPVWRPRYGGGTRVQFANRPADLERPDKGWRQPRVLYVHHPSDPVGNATLEALWRRPEWTDRPQGYGVDFVAGWAAVAPPAGWTAADSARLQRHLPPE